MCNGFIYCIKIEYLAQHGFVRANTNEILENFDQLIHIVISHSIMNIGNICDYGKYCVARLKNPVNRDENPFSNSLVKCLTLLVDGLSVAYNTYQNLFDVIDFLADVVSMGICSNKAHDYLNYAIDKLETTVYEYSHFGIYPGTFHPLLAGILLYNAAEKTKNEYYSDRASHFINTYEPDFRQFLSSRQSINLGFLYNYLWEKTYCDIYRELSDKWLSAEIHHELSYHELVESGMRLLSMADQSEVCIVQKISFFLSFFKKDIISICYIPISTSSWLGNVSHFCCTTLGIMIPLLFRQLTIILKTCHKRHTPFPIYRSVHYPSICSTLCLRCSNFLICIWP